MSDSGDSGRSGGAGKGGPRKGGAGKGARGGPGASKGTDRPRGGKPGFGGKPAGERGAKPLRAKPAGATDGPRGERKPFAKREGAAPQGDRKPFRARPERAEGNRKPFVKREGAGERGSFHKRESEGGAPSTERKPYRPRAEGAPDGERKPFRPRPEGDRKPFVKREASGADRAPAGEKRPYVKRGDEAPSGERKPYRARTDRPDAERKPFVRREGEAERKPFVKRDGGGERGSFRKSDDAPRTGQERAPRTEGARAFTPRSHGMMSHGGRKSDGDATERPRSYGRLSHDGAPGGDRKPRAAADRPPRSDDRAPRRAESAGEGAASDGTMRVAKRLARAGIASRRDAEGMIADGRVSLNGKLLDSPAVDVTMADRIEVDGKPLPAIERTRLWLFHKPAGLVTTNRDPEGRPTVFDRLPEDMPRVLSIGRLDINTEGLLLLTNDGGLARVLELPATGWLRRYRVRARGEITQERLDELRQGVAVEGVFYGAIEATLDRSQGSNVWLTLGLREGKNREVKRVLGHLGLEVNRLIRISFGPFQLGELDEGAVQEIKGRMLRDQLGERLIEEAGADFDAPIVTPFSNKPVAAERRPEPSAEKPERPERSERSERPARAKSEWISASDSTPNRKKFGSAKREDALGRLDTKAPRSFKDRGDDRGDRAGRTFEKRGDKPFGSRGDKPTFAKAGDKPGDKPDRRPSAPQTRRSANVWMAPGARATGETKKAEREDRAKRFPRTDGPRSGGFKPRGDDSPGRPRSGASDRPGGDRPRGDRPGGDRPRGGAGRGGKG